MPQEEGVNAHQGIGSITSQSVGRRGHRCGASNPLQDGPAVVQTYLRNKIDPDDMASINTKDHSTYIEVARADPGSVIRESVFSVAAYREVLDRKGGDVPGLTKRWVPCSRRGCAGPGLLTPQRCP